MSDKKQPSGWAVQLPQAAQSTKNTAPPEPQKPQRAAPPPPKKSHNGLMIGGAFLALTWYALHSFSGSPGMQRQARVSANVGEQIGTDELARADADFQRLLENGLPRMVLVRDWAAVDGDGVMANGARIVAGGVQTPVALSAGALTLLPFAGSEGCITLEIAPTNVTPYRLCLDPGISTPPITVH